MINEERMRAYRSRHDPSERALRFPSEAHLRRHRRLVLAVRALAYYLAPF